MSETVLLDILEQVLVNLVINLVHKISPLELLDQVMAGYVVYACVGIEPLQLNVDIGEWSTPVRSHFKFIFIPTCFSHVNSSTNIILSEKRPCSIVIIFLLVAVVLLNRLLVCQLLYHIFELFYQLVQFGLVEHLHLFSLREKILYPFLSSLLCSHKI